MATGQERSNPASKRKEKGSKEQPRHRGGGGSIDPHLRKGRKEGSQDRDASRAGKLGLFLGKGRGRGEPGRQERQWPVLGRRREILLSFVTNPCRPSPIRRPEVGGGSSFSLQAQVVLYFSLVLCAPLGMFFPSSPVFISLSA